MNTVLAGRGRRISVPLPASSWIGRPLGGISVAIAGADGGPGEVVSGLAAVTLGGASGDTSCAELLAPTRRKPDAISARDRSPRITAPPTQNARSVCCLFAFTQDNLGVSQKIRKF